MPWVRKIINLYKTSYVECSVLHMLHISTHIIRHSKSYFELRKLLLFCTVLKIITMKFWSIHSIKSVRIRSYSGLHFPSFGLNTETLRIESECGKMQTRITLNTDTFHAVMIIVFCFQICLVYKTNKLLVPLLNWVVFLSDYKRFSVLRTWRIVIE